MDTHYHIWGYVRDEDGTIRSMERDDTVYTTSRKANYTLSDGRQYWKAGQVLQCVDSAFCKPMPEDIPDRYVTWRDVAAFSIGPQPVPEGVDRGLEASVYWEPETYTFPYTANVAVVSVDPDNGHVELLNFYSVNDFGVLVNPLVAHG